LLTLFQLSCFASRKVIRASVIPEPGILALLGGGLVGRACLVLAQLARVAPFEVARLGSLQMSRKEIKSLNQRPGESRRASIVQDSAQSKRDIPQEAGLFSPTP